MMSCEIFPIWYKRKESALHPTLLLLVKRRCPKFFENFFQVRVLHTMTQQIIEKHVKNYRSSTYYSLSWTAKHRLSAQRVSHLRSQNCRSAPRVALAKVRRRGNYHNPRKVCHWAISPPHLNFFLKIIQEYAPRIITLRALRCKLCSTNHYP